MRVLRTLQWGSQHGHGTAHAIRQQSDDLRKDRPWRRPRRRAPGIVGESLLTLWLLVTGARVARR